MLYHYIRITIFENVVQTMMYEAKKLSLDEILKLNNRYDTQVSIKAFDKAAKIPFFDSFEKNSRDYLSLTYARDDENLTLCITRDTTIYNKIVRQILIDIVIINATSIFLILFYSLFLSRMLLFPIKTLTLKLSTINENFLQSVKTDKIPLEFLPLVGGINKLIGRIVTFVSYQKELFIGIAHELKTPLAVMKTKNEVVLIKNRENTKYIEALRNNIDSIDKMNKMISCILEIGRQEGAQFEKPQNIEIIDFIHSVAKNFQIISKPNKIAIKTDLSPQNLKLTVQTTLLLHILQNFLQNAIKFSPQNSTILIKSHIENSDFIIQIIDEGEGIDESKDFFAPFVRHGNKSGAGLGLFLAKTASQAIGATINLSNRRDKSGTIACLKLPLGAKISKKSKK